MEWGYAEPFGQGSPRRSLPQEPYHGIEKQPVVSSSPPAVRGLARQERGDQRPVPSRYFVTRH